MQRKHRGGGGAAQKQAAAQQPLSQCLAKDSLRHRCVAFKNHL